jgi:hypothetical protein
MRPTCLNFRSPKEKTPDPYDVRVTCNGSPVVSPYRRTPSFSRDKRFRQYDNEAKKTGYLIGPGSYVFTSASRVKGGIKYKPFHIKKNPNDLLYVGHSLVLNGPNRPVFTPDVNFVKKTENRSTSASTAHHSSYKNLKNRKVFISDDKIETYSPGTVPCIASQG